MTIIKNLEENTGKVTLASFLVISSLMLSGGFYLFISEAHAAAVTSGKNTLSVPTPGSNTNHTIQFVTPTGAGDTTDTIVITFPAGFNLTGIIEDDIDIAEDTDATPGNCTGTLTDKVTAAAASATEWGFAFSGQVMTFTHPTDGANQDIAANACVIIEIGTNATASGTGVNQVNNPTKTAGVGTADIPSIAISGTFGDTGDVLVAIIEGVAVSVTVDESLSFIIAGVTNANCDTSFTTLGGPDTVTTDAAVPFATISTTNTFFHACHDLTISTNGATGYGITAEENQSLLRTGTDSNDKTIDDSLGNAGTMTHAVSDAWSTTTVNGFGYSCVLSTGGQGDCVITAGTNYRQFPCTGSATVCDPDGGGEAVTTVASSTVPVSAKINRIEYKLNISGLQPAGAYSNTVTYIASPTF